ncbi:DUF3147 family protein [Viridibacillus sp. NPDC096237]|uniref:DUF3147 family protein n=1 Tax=Viridibacillus sp. NPDC096237 TaxID=3390721 RepID=UPI003D066338
MLLKLLDYFLLMGIIAALPLISILSIVWLTLQGEQAQNLNKFVIGVLLGLPSTASMLAVIYLALKQSFHLVIVSSLGIVAWTLFLGLQRLTLNYLHISELIS